MILYTRNDLPKLLNDLHLFGIGAEIGVYTGNFSAHILDMWRGSVLYSIDPWTHQGVKLDVSDVPQDEQNRIYSQAVENLRMFKNRSKILREYSVIASKQFKDESLDFVHIDARHDYRSFSADLSAWYPKVRIGGVVSGHDYKNSCVRKNLVEVKRAVDNFFIQRETVFSTVADNIPSWYVIRKANG